MQETGDRRQETGDRRQETGDRRQGKRCKENCRRLQGGEQVRVESRSVAAATARAGVIWERGCFPPPLFLLTNHVPVALLRRWDNFPVATTFTGARLALAGTLRLCTALLGHNTHNNRSGDGLVLKRQLPQVPAARGSIFLRQVPQVNHCSLSSFWIASGMDNHLKRRVDLR